MKPSRLFPSTLACFLAAGLLGQAPVRAADDDQAAHKAAAEALVNAMHMDASFTATSERMLTNVNRFIDVTARRLGNKPEAADFQTRMHTEAADLLKQQFNWEALKPTFVQSYADAFSTAELKDLVAFYTSPIGQKLVAKQPELSDRTGKASQDRLQQVMPMIMKLVQTESAKIKGDAAPAPGAPGAGPFPVPPAPPAFGKMPVPPSLPQPPMLPPGASAAGPGSGIVPAPPASTPAVNPAPQGTPSVP